MGRVSCRVYGRKALDHPAQRQNLCAGEVHTNTIESAFSLFKRGVIGSFHTISIKHLQGYLNEFSYRFNRRADDSAFMETVRRLAGFEPLPFDTLTAEKASPVSFYLYLRVFLRGLANIRRRTSSNCPLSVFMARV
jgi:hypothetical protein